MGRVQQTISKSEIEPEYSVNVLIHLISPEWRRIGPSTSPDASDSGFRSQSG